jgi:hypothetical protein
MHSACSRRIPRRRRVPMGGTVGWKRLFPTQRSVLFSQNGNGPGAKSTRHHRTRLPTMDSTLRNHQRDRIRQSAVRKTFDRPMDAKTRPCGFEYVKSTEACHIAFRRVGGLAGRCYKVDDTPLSAQSHYFIRLNADVQCNAERIIAQINRHTFPSNTIGPRSLSKSEASTVINAIIRSDSSYSEEP